MFSPEDSINFQLSKNPKYSVICGRGGIVFFVN